jgi:hypothetical protein
MNYRSRTIETAGEEIPMRTTRESGIIKADELNSGVPKHNSNENQTVNSLTRHVIHDGYDPHHEMETMCFFFLN